MLVNKLNLSVGIFMALAASQAMADVQLKFENGTKGLLWRDNYNIVYQLCAAGTDASRTCAAVVGPLRFPQVDYEPALRKEFQLDKTPYAGMNGMALLRQDIDDVEKALNDPNMSDEERNKAQTKLFVLKKHELNLLVVNGVLSHLEASNPIMYDENYSENFPKILAPFKILGSNPNLPANIVRIPSIGMVGVSLESMCWYDAVGQKRPTGCQNSAVSKGCALSLGRQWRLPSLNEGEAVTQSFYGGRVYSGTTANFLEGPVCGGHGQWMQPDNWVCNPIEPTATLRTICLAKAKDVDPSGDIDGDGIPNGIDKCNSQPNDLTAPVHQDGPWIGCASGQTPDQ